VGRHSDEVYRFWNLLSMTLQTMRHENRTGRTSRAETGTHKQQVLVSI